MGKLYYNLGFLATDEVVELSVRDFIAPFVGQTRQKTKEQLARALGKVLIIDNAFQMLKGPFEMEALQEIVNCLQSPDYARKMIVILVGYGEEMKMLLHTCPPLAGLFPHEVKFSRLKAPDCMKLLDRELEKLQVSAPFLKDDKCEDYQRLQRIMNALAIGPMFANAKDIEALAQSMKSTLFDSFFKKNRSKFVGNQSRTLPAMPDLSKDQAVLCVTRLINQRKCMKPHKPFIPQNEAIEYSDDDPRFARAFAYEQMPMIEITIQQTRACAMPSQRAISYDEGDLFDNTLELEPPSRFRQPIVSATILLRPGLIGPLSSGIHAADTLEYYKLQKEVDRMYPRIELLEEESEDEEENSNPASTPPTVAPPTGDAAPKETIDTNASVKQPAQVPASSDTQFQKASLKATTDMDREEKRRYRDMLAHKYPFPDVVEERTLDALRDLGYCPQGYAWKRDLGRHICEGGCHFGYDFEVRDYMYRHDM